MIRRLLTRHGGVLLPFVGGLADSHLGALDVRKPVVDEV
jgi:hypothetical protein